MSIRHKPPSLQLLTGGVPDGGRTLTCGGPRRHAGHRHRPAHRPDRRPRPISAVVATRGLPPTVWQANYPSPTSPPPAVSSRHRRGVRRPPRSAPLPTSVDDINAAAAAAPSSTRLGLHDNALRRSPRWHLQHGGRPALAAIANDAITVLTDNQLRGQLRRCANPTCSMLFLAINPRRTWCTANICGNRARAPATTTSVTPRNHRHQT